MLGKISILFILLSVGSIADLQGQDRFIELNIRPTLLYGGDFGGDMNSADEYGAFGLTGELLFFLKRNFAVGAFYTNTISEQPSAYDGNDLTSVGVEGDFEYQSYGLTLHVTTNRRRFVRLYGVARAFQTEMVHTYPDQGFTIGEKGFGFSGGFGVIFKISDTFGFNVFDATISPLSSDFKYGKKFNKFTLQVQTGLIIKMVKRK